MTYLVVEALPVYDPAAICPKCGQTPVGSRACTYTTPDHFVWSGTKLHHPMWPQVVGSHIHRTCGRCQNEWIELALDARMMTQEEAAHQFDEWSAEAERLRKEEDERADLRRRATLPETPTETATKKRWWEKP